MRFTTVTNLMKLKLKRSFEYNLKMHVKLCITNILDLRIKEIKYKMYVYTPKHAHVHIHIHTNPNVALSATYSSAQI